MVFLHVYYYKKRWCSLFTIMASSLFVIHFLNIFFDVILILLLLLPEIQVCVLCLQGILSMGIA